MKQKPKEQPLDSGPEKKKKGKEKEGESPSPFEDVGKILDGGDATDKIGKAISGAGADIVASVTGGADADINAKTHAPESVEQKDAWVEELKRRFRKNNGDESIIHNLNDPPKELTGFLKRIEEFTRRVTKNGTAITPDIIEQVREEATNADGKYFGLFKNDFPGLMIGIQIVRSCLDDLSYDVLNFPPPETLEHKQKQAEFLSVWCKETGLERFSNHRIEKMTIDSIEREETGLLGAEEGCGKFISWRDSYHNVERQEKRTYANLRGKLTVTSGLTGKSHTLSYLARIYRLWEDVAKGKPGFRLDIALTNEGAFSPDSAKEIDIDVPSSIGIRDHELGLDCRHLVTPKDRKRFQLGELNVQKYITKFKYYYLELHQELTNHVQKLLESYNLLSPLMTSGCSGAVFEVASDLTHQTQREWDKALLDGIKTGYIPEKLLYTGGGAERFREVVYGKEYKMGKTEGGLIKEEAPAIAAAIGNSDVIDLGCFDGTKIKPLLDEQVSCSGRSRYHALDISPQNVYWTMETMRDVEGIKADGFILDYEQGLDRFKSVTPKTIVLLGTLANYPTKEQKEVLDKIKASMRYGDHVLIGVQMRRDIKSIEKMYNNKEAKPFGVGPLVDRLGISLKDVDYSGKFNKETSRMEMKVKFGKKIKTVLCGEELVIPKGCELTMVVSHKYEVEDLIGMIEGVGLDVDFQRVDRESNQLLVLASLKGSKLGVAVAEQ